MAVDVQAADCSICCLANMTLQWCLTILWPWVMVYSQGPTLCTAAAVTCHAMPHKVASTLPPRQEASKCSKIQSNNTCVLQL